MKLKYFAWVRERIGKAEEEITLPDNVETAGDLMVWLKGQGEEYAHAFAEERYIRVAADQRHVPHDFVITGAHEVALFPQMTGG